MAAERVSEHPGDAELATAIRLLGGRVVRRLRQEAAGGLTVSQLSALSSIDRHGPLHLGELARIESVAPPTLTRVVAQLEREGLVRRGTDADDRRAVLVEVTDAGRRAITDVRGARARFLSERLRRLTVRERAVLAEAVTLIDRLLDDDGRR